MQFLLARIGWRADILPAMMSAFEKQTGVTLPPVYKTKIGALETEPGARFYRTPPVINAGAPDGVPKSAEAPATEAPKASPS